MDKVKKQYETSRLSHIKRTIRSNPILNNQSILKQYQTIDFNWRDPGSKKYKNGTMFELKHHERGFSNY